MVLMPVGNQDAPHPLRPFHQIGNIGNNQVNAQLLLGGKLHPAVHDDYILAALQGHHILADFPQTAQGDDPQGTAVVPLQTQIDASPYKRFSCSVGGAAAGSGRVDGSVTGPCRACSRMSGIRLKSSTISPRISCRYKAAAGCIIG